MIKTCVFIVLSLLLPVLSADQGGFRNSGGSASGGNGITIASTTASPSGNLTISCPGTTAGACGGGNFTFLSTDGTLSVIGAFTSGSYAESCAGGGKGGHISCGYSLTGYFSGTATQNGVIQAITGVTYQSFGTAGGGASGVSGWNSAYAPFYYSDSEQILRSDDLQGTNQVAFNGGDATGFYGAYGIALDSAGRIYVADTYNCRVTRFDNMNGDNWTTYGGGCGSGQGQFYDPTGIAVDPAGKIYILDAGNYRIVRIDDMSGANWVAYGAQGNGAGQFSSYLTSLAVDASARVYVADTGNLRIVRFDDMTGTNWTALSQSQPVNGATYSFSSPVAVALDSAGKIYVADNGSYQPAVIRVDDMTGANWTSLYVGSGGGLNGIAVDPAGTVFLSGGGVRFVDNMSTVLSSSGSIAPIGSYYAFGITPIPVPSPRPSAAGMSPTSLTFTQNVGTSSPPQTVTLFNFGGSNLNLGNISATGSFAASSNCPAALAPGANCSISVSFNPTLTGDTGGTVTILDDSGNAGTSQSITLDGTGTMPVASLSPASLSFQSTVVGATSSPRTLTLTDSGTGPMQVRNVTVSGPFSQTNTCSAALAPGSSCAFSVSFSPVATGSASGTLTITDDAGTQTVALTGSGSAQVTLSSSSLSFGTIAVSDTSTAKTVSITNHEASAITLGTVSITGPFAIATNACGTSLAAGASCTVGVTFTPTSAASATGALTFTDSAVNSPQTVSLSGTAVSP